jgi:hypothetical protein
VGNISVPGTEFNWSMKKLKNVGLVIGRAKFNVFAVADCAAGPEPLSLSGYLSTMAAGVPAGAAMPYHALAS